MKAEQRCVACSVPRRAKFGVRDLNAPDGQFFVCEDHAKFIDDESMGTSRGLEPGFIWRLPRAT